MSTAVKIFKPKLNIVKYSPLDGFFLLGIITSIFLFILSAKIVFAFLFILIIFCLFGCKLYESLSRKVVINQNLIIFKVPTNYFITLEKKFDLQSLNKIDWYKIELTLKGQRLPNPTPTRLLNISPEEYVTKWPEYRKVWVSNDTHFNYFFSLTTNNNQTSDIFMHGWDEKSLNEVIKWLKTYKQNIKINELTYYYGLDPRGTIPWIPPNWRGNGWWR